MENKIINQTERRNMNATILIRFIDVSLKRWLARRAKRNKRSMNTEAQAIFETARKAEKEA